MGKLSIKIDVDTATKEIRVTDDAGSDRTLKSIIVVGGDYQSGAFYLFSEGSSSDAGWALSNSYKWARMTDHPAGPYYQKVFNHFLKWIATFLGFTASPNITGTELLERWSKEDTDRAIEEGKNTTFN